MLTETSFLHAEDIEKVFRCQLLGTRRKERCLGLLRIITRDNQRGPFGIVRRSHQHHVSPPSVCQRYAAHNRFTLFLPVNHDSTALQQVKGSRSMNLHGGVTARIPGLNVI